MRDSGYSRMGGGGSTSEIVCLVFLRADTCFLDELGGSSRTLSNLIPGKRPFSNVAVKKTSHACVVGAEMCWG